MKVTKLEIPEDIPFVSIEFTREEAEILRELVRYNINGLERAATRLKLNLPSEANYIFAFPLYTKLDELLGA